MSLWSFQGPRGLERPVLQNSTAYVHCTTSWHRSSRSTFVPGEPVVPTAEAIKGTGACRSKSSGIPRKEVIQPQLPLRLPCYEVAPVSEPAFGGCLACGLGHRVRVLATVGVCRGVGKRPGDIFAA